MAATITVLYDNEALQEPLTADWGFAALIADGSGERVLFDAGASGDILLHNARAIGEDLSNLSAVVLSHWHWDHAGGLSTVAQLAPKASFFVPFGADSSWPDVMLCPVLDKPVRISGSVYSTGVVGGIEQALVIMSDTCPLLLTGCAHPGVPALLEAARAIAEPKGLMGGLHGFSDFDCLDELTCVYVCHCTQYKREILSRFKDKAHRCGVGLKVSV